MRRQLDEQWVARCRWPTMWDCDSAHPCGSSCPATFSTTCSSQMSRWWFPGSRGQTDVEHLPALRAFREFSPGNVSRHFGVWATNKRHWVPLPPRTSDGSPMRVDLETIYGVESPGDTVDVDAWVDVYPPRAVTLAAVPAPVKDYSSVQPDWEFHAAELGTGEGVRLGRGSDQVLATLTAHVHVQGGGARIMRFARTASGTVWDPTGRPVRLQYGVGGSNSWRSAAVGVDVHCDALAGVAQIPDVIAAPTPAERSSRLRHRLLVEADLPVELSSFDRESLSEVVLLAVTRYGSTGSSWRITATGRVRCWTRLPHSASSPLSMITRRRRTGCVGSLVS